MTSTFHATARGSSCPFLHAHPNGCGPHIRLHIFHPLCPPLAFKTRCGPHPCGCRRLRQTDVATTVVSCKVHNSPCHTESTRRMDKADRQLGVWILGRTRGDVRTSWTNEPMHATSDRRLHSDPFLVLHETVSHACDRARSLCLVFDRARGRRRPSHFSSSPGHEPTPRLSFSTPRTDARATARASVEGRPRARHFTTTSQPRHNHFPTISQPVVRFPFEPVSPSNRFLSNPRV